MAQLHLHLPLPGSRTADTSLAILPVYRTLCCSKGQALVLADVFLTLTCFSINRNRASPEEQEQ